MKLIANDTLHISSVGPDNIPPNGAFEVADDVGENLIRRGLARKAGAVSGAKPGASRKGK